MDLRSESNNGLAVFRGADPFFSGIFHLSIGEKNGLTRVEQWSALSPINKNYTPLDHGGVLVFFPLHFREYKFRSCNSGILIEVDLQTLRYVVLGLSPSSPTLITPLLSGVDRHL